MVAGLERHHHGPNPVERSGVAAGRDGGGLGMWPAGLSVGLDREDVPCRIEQRAADRWIGRGGAPEQRGLVEGSSHRLRDGGR